MSNGDTKQRNVKKVVLAYSGGLDTSIILKWLQTTYGCEVVTFTADLGQGEELDPTYRRRDTGSSFGGTKPTDKNATFPNVRFVRRNGGAAWRPAAFSL